MSLLEKVAGLFARPPRIADRAALADFIDSRAAFLCQKCVVEFCRVRSGVYWQKLFSEAEFQARLDQACWESYPPALAMVAEMVEAALRPHAGLRQRGLPAVLTSIAGEVFSRHQLPAGAPEGFWTDALDMVRERLDATQSGPPRPVKDMTKPSARAIFDSLPFHPEIVTNDFDYIRNNLRMNLLRAHEDFLGSANMRELIPSLLGSDGMESCSRDQDG